MSDSFYTPLTPELLCTNLDTSLAFYLDVLDFAIQYQRKECRFATIHREGSRLMLDEYENGNPRSWIAAPLEKPFGRGINLQIEIADVDTLYARVQKAGAPIFLPMEERWYRADAVELGNRQFIVLDPDGYMLRFCQHLGERPAQRK